MSEPTEPTGPHEHAERRMLAASAVMAAGTVFSRLSGFVRSALLVAALGSGLHADLFTIANTIPNMLYILLAGGVFNAVLVPQLVRAMKQDADGGEAYTQRVVTVAALFLAVVTVALVAAAPAIMSLFLDPAFDDPRLAAHRESVVAFARWCLPQVFFYGMFVLVGQVLNARDRFGPMMWAPIANNVISVAVLATYLVVYGPVSPIAACGPFTGRQEALLGLGSTLGIVAQFLVLLPYLRAAGFRFRPRFDLRGSGLGHTLRLGVWTVLFVVVNQVAYTVVVRLASGGTAQGALAACPAPASPATGYTVYATAFLIVMVPHAVVTVSLATALLPRLSALAAEDDLPGLAGALVGTLRTALCVIVPFAALLPVVALDLAQVLLGFGAGARGFASFAPTLALFGPGLVLFTVHYLMLRGLYALERTRTAFWIQCVIAATNVAVAVVAVRAADPPGTAPALVTAFAAAYVVGTLVSFLVVARLLGGLDARGLAAFLARLAVATAAATLAGYAVTFGLDAVLAAPPGPAPWWRALVRLLAVGVTDAAVFLGLARVLQIGEVSTVLAAVGGRRGTRG